MTVMTTLPRLAKEMGKSPDTLREWARREVDPMPLRYVDGDRYGSIIVSEFEKWLVRNSKLANERGKDGD